MISGTKNSASGGTALSNNIRLYGHPPDWLRIRFFVLIFVTFVDKCLFLYPYLNRYISDCQQILGGSAPRY